MFRGRRGFSERRRAAARQPERGLLVLPHAEAQTIRRAIRSGSRTTKAPIPSALIQRLPPSEADHCFLCHSLRSFSPAFDKFQHHHHAPRTERLHLAPIDRARCWRGRWFPAAHRQSRHLRVRTFTVRLVADTMYEYVVRLFEKVIHMKVLSSLLLILAIGGVPHLRRTGRARGPAGQFAFTATPFAPRPSLSTKLKREVVSGPDGTFRFDNLAPGTYHVWVRTQGYSSRRTEVDGAGCRHRSSCTSISISTFRRSRR